jgi:hypothetical protein
MQLTAAPRQRADFTPDVFLDGAATNVTDTARATQRHRAEQLFDQTYEHGLPAEIRLNDGVVAPRDASGKLLAFPGSPCLYAAGNG